MLKVKAENLTIINEIFKMMKNISKEITTFFWMNLKFKIEKNKKYSFWMEVAKN